MFKFLKKMGDFFRNKFKRKPKNGEGIKGKKESEKQN